MKVNIVVIKRHLLPLFYTIDAQKKSFFTIVFDEIVQTCPFLIYSGHESRRDNSILKGYQLKVQLPGVKPEDIDLTVQENTLTLKGKYDSSTKEEKKGNLLIHETRSGSFGRSVRFARPIDADKIDTSYENGILTISVPVSEAGHPKRISINKEPASVDKEQSEKPAEVR